MPVLMQGFLSWQDRCKTPFNHLKTTKMARIEVTMPKMGESITEGTVVEWAKKVGDMVEQDETLLEIATDKVDSEVPAPEAGVLVEILVEEGETVEVGKPIAILETDPDAAADSAGKPDGDEKKATADEEESGGDDAPEEDSGKDTPDEKGGKAGASAAADKEQEEKPEEQKEPKEKKKQKDAKAESVQENGREKRGEPAKTAAGDGDGAAQTQRKGSDGRFYSPLVRSIAREEGLSQEELESLEGSGSQGRVTKQDVLDYVKAGKPGHARTAAGSDSGLRKPGKTQDAGKISTTGLAPKWPEQSVEIIKMDRMRKVISEHMIRSKQTSAHVTTFGEADVTRLVQYRDKHKDRFLKENGFKLTFTPFFIEATIQAIREFPLINSSVDGDEIHLKRAINYGIAVALGEAGTGGLVVPVIKNAGEMNLQGLARQTHVLAGKARSKQLSPDDLVGGTFTLTNYGSVGNLMGTPIINQPQVAIFGTGIIQKRPVVIEVDGTDTIAIRHMVYLSMSYDHRIIDGAMGGAFVQRVKELLENFDTNRTI
jgi:pyruvate/2-oxoglutarate dehydrogenase complex dihydrolipoamide acyltransferase (E2) component